MPSTKRCKTFFSSLFSVPSVLIRLKLIKSTIKIVINSITASKSTKWTNSNFVSKKTAKIGDII